jgi:hypothetical protein
VSVLYPCVCCGYLVFDQLPGSFDLCSLCYWEDDSAQLRWPTLAGGANSPSLIDSQRNVQLLGAMESQFVALVRRPGPGDVRDPGWRPFDPTTDRYLEPYDTSVELPSDWTRFYWWRPGYWLAPT